MTNRVLAIGVSLVVLISAGCASNNEAEPVGTVPTGENTPATSAAVSEPPLEAASLLLTPAGQEEIYVLPTKMPDGFDLAHARFPSPDSHPNFAGSVTLSDDNELITLSIRWIARTHTRTDSPIDDTPAAGLPVEVAGTTIFAQPSSRFVSIPFTDGTTVEVTLDQAFEDTAPDVIAALVGALAPATEEQWLEAVASLSGDPAPCSLSVDC